MTVQDTSRKAGPFSGNDVTTQFPFDFKVFTTSDVYVVKLDDSTGIQTVLNLGSDYTVTLNFDQDSDAGGVVTLPTALSTGYSLTLTSNVADNQEVKLTNQGGFLPNVLNNVFDKSTIQIQQLKVDVDRSLKLPLSTATNVSAQWPIPEPLKIPRWNVLGTAIEYIDQSGMPGTINAENVIWTPPWTNAVQRTQSDINLPTFSPEDFGAVDDGVTDCYQAFKNMIAAVNAHGRAKVVFECNNTGEYYLDQIEINGGPNQNNITPLRFENCDGIEIEGNGATISCKKNWVYSADYEIAPGVTKSYKHQLGLRWISCKNVIVNNLTINQNNETITKVATAENLSHSFIIGGGENIQFNNCNSLYALVDGFMPLDGFESENVKNMTMINCTSLYSARQGLSVIQCNNLYALNCVFSFTGTSSFGSFAPRAGVDIEPDSNVNNGQHIFENCEFKDNAGFQWVVSNPTSTPLPVYFEKCRMISTDATLAGAVNPASAYVFVNNCYFDNVNYQPAFGISWEPETVFSSLTNSILLSPRKSGQPLLYVASDPANCPHLLIENNRIYLNSPTAIDDGHFRIFLRGGNIRFRNNYIFIKNTEFPVSGTRFLLLQQLIESQGNVFDTDLSSGVGLIKPQYSDTLRVDDYSRKPSNVFGDASENVDGKMYRGTVQSIQFNVSGGRRVFYQNGTSAPVSGSYVQGDIFYDLIPTAGGFAGIVCVTGGTPGTWKTFGAISV